MQSRSSWVAMTSQLRERRNGHLSDSTALPLRGVTDRRATPTAVRALLIFCTECHVATEVYGIQQGQSAR